MNRTTTNNPVSRESEFPPTEEGNLKLYLTFARKNWIIKVASWSEVKPTPS